jgi:membrane fusion protein, heavy metal efflux system
MTPMLLPVRLLAIFLAGAAPLALAACSGADSPAEEAAGHGGGIRVTDYTDSTELFVEHRPLVRGSQRRFDAHLSWIGDYRAVNEGSLAAELVWPDGKVDRGTANVSDTPGIFRPLVRASRAGQAQLRLVLTARGRTSVHELGRVTVHPDRATADRSLPPEEEQPDAIVFTKEVQWRIPFLAEPARTERLGETIPVTVDVRLAPNAEAVVSAPVDGIVRAARVPAPGMSVRRGQVLASLSSTLGGGEDVATLDLGIAEARIARDAAAREQSRMASLVRAEAVPERRLDEANTAVRLANAQLAAAQARRSALAGGGAGVPLVAPISGTILSSTLVQGAGVAAGSELMRIGNTGSLWLVAHVPEAMAARVGQPNALDIVLPDGTVALRAGNGLTLVQRGGYIDPRTRTMDVIFATGSSSLRPGQRVQGRIATGGATDALTIPASAILNEAGQDVVYVQIAAETFERRIVTVVQRSGNRVAIDGDVRAGERVVTRGAAAMRAAAATPGAFGHGHAH